MRTTIGVITLLVAGGVVFAQQRVERDVVVVAPPGAGSGIAHALPLPAAEFGAQMQVEFLAAEFGGKVVKGSPYSAEEVTETKQVLADGNRIINKTTALVYRDSQGRTRREQSLGTASPWSTELNAGALKMILINDPVAGVNYTLDPMTKTARKVPTVDVMSHTSADRMAPEATRVVERKLVIAHEQAGADMASAAAPMGERQVFERRTQVPHSEGAADMAATSGIRVLIRHGETGAANTESLGKQVIEGVEAEGTRITATIPAGQVGNELPIQTYSETWNSPSLQTVVLSKQSDPRMGETTFRLTNLSLSEPAPSLFQVPADYKLVDAKTVLWQPREGAAITK